MAERDLNPWVHVLELLLPARELTVACLNCASLANASSSSCSPNSGLSNS